MKKLWQIARLELSLLFHSPIAWLLLLILFGQLSISFLELLEGMRQAMVQGKLIPHLTHEFFSNPEAHGIFWHILPSLFLYIPLLTMGLLSRETSSGTIRLLYSSPLSIRQIIYGKFLAMILLSLCFTAVFLLFVAGSVIWIPHCDYPEIFSALISIFLLLCTYSAIGLFLSGLTTYQVVAGIGTFILLGVLNHIGDIGQGTDVLRDIMYSLAMPQRMERMVRGLLTTRDVLYLLVVTGLFLALSISRLQMARDGRRWWQKTAQYAGVISCALVLLYVSSRPRLIGYWDVTATGMNTVSPATQEILHQFRDSVLEVTEYSNVIHSDFGMTNPYERIRIGERWEPYQRFVPNFSFRYVYYYDSVPELYKYPAYKNKTLLDFVDMREKIFPLNRSSLLTPEEIRKRIDLSGEDNRVVMQLRYRGRTTFLRTYADPEFWPAEAEVAAALKRLLVKPPRLLFATDGYARRTDKIGDREYATMTSLKTARKALVNQGFDVDTISLRQDTIPGDITGLVIADMRVMPDPVVLGKIRRYVAGGGNLLLAGEPGKQAVNNAMLAMIGVRMLDGTIVQYSQQFSMDLVTPYMTGYGVSLHRALQPNLIVSMPGVAGVRLDGSGGAGLHGGGPGLDSAGRGRPAGAGMPGADGAGAWQVHPLLLTNSSVSWNKMGKLVLDSALFRPDQAAGDQFGTFPTALAMTRVNGEREQRILVTGDADFLSNGELSRPNMRTANKFLFTGIFSWFAHGEFPVDVVLPESQDVRLTISETGVLVMRVLYWGLFPALLILLATIHLIRRKRK